MMIFFRWNTVGLLIFISNKFTDYKKIAILNFLLKGILEPTAIKYNSLNLKLLLILLIINKKVSLQKAKNVLCRFDNQVFNLTVIIITNCLHCIL